MEVRLEKSEISTLVSLVTFEIEKRTGGENGYLNHASRLTDVHNKLLAMLVNKRAPSSNPSDSDLPEFRDYARKRYPAELDDDLITMIEDLIERRRQKAR